MSRKRLMIFALVLFAFSSLVYAQNLTYGANLELAMPMGDFSDMASMGFGGSAQAEYAINEQVTGIGSIGYLMWGGKDNYKDMDYSWSCIPIKAGAKYALGESGLYGVLELGIYMFSYEYDFEYVGFYDETYHITGDESESEIGFAPGIGYQMPFMEKYKLDFSAQYEMAGDFDFLGIDVGIRF